MTGAGFFIAFLAAVFLLMVAIFRLLDCVKASREETAAIERFWRERAQARDEDSRGMPERFTKPHDRGPRAA